MAEIEFILQRIFLGETYTIGKLSLSDKHLCDSIEDKVRDYNKDGDLLDAGETKVFGETAIPYGRRRVTIVFSPHFKRKVPLIHDVPHFTAIEMHAGTTAKDSHGCIIVGENDEKGKVHRSRYWEAYITNMIDDYIEQGNEVYINII